MIACGNGLTDAMFSVEPHDHCEALKLIPEDESAPWSHEIDDYPPLIAAKG